MPSLICLGQLSNSADPCRGNWSLANILNALLPPSSTIVTPYPLPVSSPPTSLPIFLPPMSTYDVRFWATTQAWLELRDPDAGNLGSPNGVVVL